MSQKTWNRIFDAELIIGILSSLIIGIASQNISQIFWPRLCWFTLIFLIIVFALRIYGQKNHRASLVSKWISSITLVQFFYFLTYTGISVLNIVARPLTLVWSILGLILLLVVGIPVVVVNFPVVKNWFMRLFMGFTIYLNLYNVNRFWDGPAWVKQILTSVFWIAIATFILAFFIFRAWGFKFNWNLKLVRTKHFQVIALIVLVLLSIWFAFFNTFINLTSTWTEMLCFWQWDFSEFEVTSKAVIAAASAGILEETVRCINLVVLLYAMRNFKGRIFASVLATAIIFGLSHLPNLGSSSFGMYYDLEATLQQVVYAFGAGMLLAVIYLYTGKLWLSMMIHGLVDLITFSRTPLTPIPNPLIPWGWETVIILMLIPLVIALVMMTGKRRKFMEDNVNRIIAVGENN